MEITLAEILHGQTISSGPRGDRAAAQRSRCNAPREMDALPSEMRGSPPARGNPWSPGDPSPGVPPCPWARVRDQDRLGGDGPGPGSDRDDKSRPFGRTPTWWVGSDRCAYAGHSHVGSVRWGGGLVAAWRFGQQRQLAARPVRGGGRLLLWCAGSQRADRRRAAAVSDAPGRFDCRFRGAPATMAADSPATTPREIVAVHGRRGTVTDVVMGSL